MYIILSPSLQIRSTFWNKCTPLLSYVYNQYFLWSLNSGIIRKSIRLMHKIIRIAGFIRFVVIILIRGNMIFVHWFRPKNSKINNRGCGRLVLKHGMHKTIQGLLKEHVFLHCIFSPVNKHSMYVRGCQIGMQGPQLCAKPGHFCKLDVATSRMAFLDLNLHGIQLATLYSKN